MNKKTNSGEDTLQSIRRNSAYNSSRRFALIFFPRTSPKYNEHFLFPISQFAQGFTIGGSVYRSTFGRNDRR